MHADAVIIGGGHNGLVCANYLAAAGLKTVVIERRDVVGGAAVTESFHPGFRNSVASYTVSLLHPQIIRDLELARHGLRIVERPLGNFLPTADGGYLKVGGHRTQPEVARHSQKDAERLAGYEQELERVADLLRALVLQRPPNLRASGWRDQLAELWHALRLGRPFRQLPQASRQELLRLFACSAGDYLDDWFESDPIKAVLGFDGVVGHYASPYAPGSAYVLLHHCFGEVNGRKGAWGHALGGMGAITQAMARSAIERGVEIITGDAVREVLIRRGQACGIKTDSGREVHSPRVVSNLNPRLLFEALVDPAALPAEFSRRMRQWRCGSGTFRMNVALSELPDFRCLPGRQAAEHHGAGIIIAPTLGYMEQAYFDARTQGWARQPIVEMLIPSTLDDSLAPPGQHVASLFCQHVAPTLPDGMHWDDQRDRVADLMIETVNTHAPNFKASVIAREALSPLDLERRFGLVGGDIFHGALSLDQMFSARPTLGYADYRTPVTGLYQCGAGTHPGGGVTGAPGHNAAREILKDRRRVGRKARSIG